MKVISQPHRDRCPRCRFGFIIVEGTFDAESTCLNCGYHPPSLTPAAVWLSDIDSSAPAPEPLTPPAPIAGPSRKVA